jgi:hypothetical protein
MLISGLGNFGKKPGQSEFEKLVGSKPRKVTESESLSQERKYRTAKAARKSRQRAKKG